MRHKTEINFKLNSKSCAEVVQMTSSAILKWEIPREKIGGDVWFDIRDVVRYKLDQIKNDSEKESLAKEKTRLTRAQAEKTEHDLEIQKGSLIPYNVVQNVWTDILLNFKSKLYSIPNKIAPILEGLKAAEIEANLKTEVNSILMELRELDVEDYVSMQIEQEETEEIPKPKKKTTVKKK